MAAYYPPMPPAGAYPQQSYYPLPYPQQEPPYPYQTPPAPYTQPPYQPQPPYAQPRAPQYPYQPPYQQPFSPAPQTYSPPPPAEGGFHQPTPTHNWDPKQIWSEYNNSPEPQYGKPESQSTYQGPQGGETYSARGQTWPNNGTNFDPSSSQAQGQEGERGLGATVLGGGAGALVGHKMLKNHGTLGTVAGLAVGAIVANAWEHHEKEKKERRREERAYEEGARSRGLEEEDYEDREYERDYDEEYEPRHHHHQHRREEDYDDGYYERDDYRDEEYYDRRDGY